MIWSFRVLQLKHTEKKFCFDNDWPPPPERTAATDDRRVRDQNKNIIDGRLLHGGTVDRVTIIVAVQNGKSHNENETTDTMGNLSSNGMPVIALATVERDEKPWNCTSSRRFDGSKHPRLARETVKTKASRLLFETET